MDPDDFFGRTEKDGMTAETERGSKLETLPDSVNLKRLEFLEAYESLGPGRLTTDEQHELTELRCLKALAECKIVFDDNIKVDDDDDVIINTGNITVLTAEDIKYFIEKMKFIFSADGDRDD